MPKVNAPIKSAANRSPKTQAKTSTKPKPSRIPCLKYIGRNRETCVCGITFELNKAVPVPDAALFAKLSLNPYFEVVT